MIEFSVIILTYNCTMKQILRTVDSVIRQQNINYEILFCDDCSKENYFEEITEELKKRGVSKEQYKLLGSPINQKTVKNVLKGLREARGKYTKLIGAGDMLYDEYTLRNIYDFLEREQAEGCFGIMRGFRETDKGMEFETHGSPRDILAYRLRDEKTIIKNLALCEDWVSGAGTFAKTAYYMKYISMLEDKVLYCEDWSTGLAAIDHVFLRLYDRYVVWYELGSGISTTANPTARKRIFADNRGFCEVFDRYAREQSPKEFKIYINKRRRKKKLEHVNCVWIKNIYKAIVTPEMVLYEFKMRRLKRQGVHQPKEETKGFLDEADSFAK